MADAKTSKHRKADHDTPHAAEASEIVEGRKRLDAASEPRERLLVRPVLRPRKSDVDRLPLEMREFARADPRADRAGDGYQHSASCEGGTLQFRVTNR